MPQEGGPKPLFPTQPVGEDSGPRPLNFGAVKQRTIADHAAPRALYPEDHPRALKFPDPVPAPPRYTTADHALMLSGSDPRVEGLSSDPVTGGVKIFLRSGERLTLTRHELMDARAARNGNREQRTPAETLTLHSMGAPPREISIAQAPSRPAPKPAPTPGTRVIGGNPKAPAMLKRAEEVDAKAAADIRFRNKLEEFLDLKPSGWASWGERDLNAMGDAASEHLKLAQDLTRAEAVKWAAETREAYNRPPGFFNRKPKVEFYKQMLEGARDQVTAVWSKLETRCAELRPKLATLRLDVVVLQVATEKVDDTMHANVAAGRMRNLVNGQHTAEMILQSMENLKATAAAQQSDLSDVLTTLIPNWLLAQSKA